MDSKEKLAMKSLEDIKCKTEPGTSKPPVQQRLMSLKPARDLSLSAYRNVVNPNASILKSKIYIPNLNVQRNKPSESATKPKPEPVKPKLPEKYEKVKPRGKKNLVQLDQGVFAQGIPGQKNVGRGRGGSGGSGGSSNDNVLRKPVLNFRTPIKVDKQEEENTMKQLLQDDFIDDPSLEPNYDNCPIVLPFTKDIDSFKKKGTESKANIKRVQYKTVKELFDGAATSDPGFIYFQMPNSIPGLKAGDETKDNSKASTSTEQLADNKPSIEQCPLKSLPGGQIGKIQILKSGRARLVLGDIKMWVDMGIQSSCKQDAVSIELDKETLTGHTYNLGPVSVRMIVTPDLDSLLVAPKPNPIPYSKLNPVLE